VPGYLLQDYAAAVALSPVICRDMRAVAAAVAAARQVDGLPADAAAEIPAAAAV
jgi:hypothetical protein